MKRLLPFLIAIPALSQTPAAEHFEKSVRPVFVKNCYGCHGPNRQSAGINFATGAGLDKTRRLLDAISYTADVKMPPTGKLSDEDIATLKQWVESGVAWPRETAAPAPLIGKQITPADRQYWAFQPIEDPLPPALPAKSPIDRFILAKLADKHIQPAHRATALTLLRRVTYDLTGLPPTPAEIDAFEADKSPGAFGKVVDRLLATPQYGERWGRHWLDVARFADSTGMDEDHVYPNAWRFRDYVVKAFNDDMPFDRFIKEQIAGDLLLPPNPVATGFLALGPKPLAQQDRIQMIYDVVDEQIDTTSKAFLGITVACARCHDHKFDPILTRDYYALAGIFASTQAFRNLGSPGSVSYIYNTPLDPAAYNQYQTHRWKMYAKQLEMEEASIEDWTRESALPRTRIAEWMLGARANATDKDAIKWRKWLDAAGTKAREGYLKKWFDATNETAPAVAEEYENQYTADAAKWESQINRWRTRLATEMAQERDIPARPKPDAEGAPFFVAAAFNGGPLELPDSDRVALLRREFTEFQKSLGPEPAMAAAVAEGVPVDQHIFLHGDHHSEGASVDRTFPLVLAGDSQTPPAKGSGRLELANWLAAPDNPLTPRVIVNRVWQWHFGEGIMRTPNNWGKTGDKPDNPELLDYLAKRFIESGWSIKSLHRMILLSDAYQRSVEATPEGKELDPANRLKSRFNRLRMSVEEIRDSVLSLSGELDATLGGTLAATKGRKFDTDNFNRRTLYIPVRRGSVPAILSNFDFGDATTSSEGRSRTNIAPQALFVMNSRFVVDRSREFAKRLLDDGALSDPQRIERAYLMALTRRPQPDEVDAALTYVESLRNKLPEADFRLAAWQSLCHVLISTNEFLYLQ
jgi:cytochrome c553